MPESFTVTPANLSEAATGCGNDESILRTFSSKLTFQTPNRTMNHSGMCSIHPNRQGAAQAHALGSVGQWVNLDAFLVHAHLNVISEVFVHDLRQVLAVLSLRPQSH